MKNFKLKLAVLTLLISVNTLAAKVKKIEVKNLNSLTKEFIMEKLPVNVGGNFEEADAEKIKKELLKTGLIADVNITANKGWWGKVDLVIDVTEIENAAQIKAQIEEESKRTDLLVTSVKVVGNKNINLDEVLKNSRLKAGEYFVPITIKELSAAIFSTGYFKSVVPEINRNADSKSIEIIIKVAENPIIRNVSIKGATLFTEQQLIDIAQLNKGKIFNALNLNPQFSPILNAYYKNGIITAKFEDFTVSEDGDINIVLTEGVIEEIAYKKKIESADDKRLSEKKSKLKTKDFVFERMTNVKKGDFLTESALSSTMKEYFRTGLFNSIEPAIEVSPTNPNGRKVTFLVEERPTTSINGQVSYESKEGFTGGITFADKNLLGTQRDLAIQANFGTRGNYELNASFFDPWVQGTDRLQVGASVFFKREKAKKSDLEKPYKIKDEAKKDIELPYQLGNILRASGSYIYGGSVTLGKGFKNNIFVTVKPRIYGIKTTNAVNVLDKKSNKKPQVLVDYTLGSVILGVSYDTRDDAYIPKNGMYIDGTVELGYIFREKSLTDQARDELNKKVLDYKKDVLDKKYSEEEKNKDAKIKAMVDAKTNVDKYKKMLDEANNHDKNDIPKIKKDLEEAKKVYDKAVNDKILADEEKLKLENKSENFLKTRPYYKVNVDARFYHKVYKDKNSMAYRLTLGYASKGTPANMLFNTSDGTYLRGYENESASILATATVENRTYVNNYVQIVVFAEAGIHNKATDHYYKDRYNGIREYTEFKEMFKKDNVKIDAGIGARLTTPLGVIRLDYAWPFMNAGNNSKGKFTFGFGQTF